jgi:uncharacterized membrane protein
MLDNAAYAIHVLFAALWVGGMAFAILALRPALAVLEAPQRLALMGRVHKRFLPGGLARMPLVLATGYLLLFGYYGGFRGAGWHVHLMHLGRAADGRDLPRDRLRAMEADARRAGRGATRRRQAASNERIRQLVTFNLALGLLTVGVAAWGRLA